MEKYFKINIFIKKLISFEIMIIKTVLGENKMCVCVCVCVFHRHQERSKVPSGSSVQQLHTELKVCK